MTFLAIVLSGCGGGGGGGSTTSPQPAPSGSPTSLTIKSITTQPASSGNGMVFIITGTGFVNGVQVVVSGITATDVTISEGGTKITCTVIGLSNSGSVNVVVTQAGQGSVSTPVNVVVPGQLSLSGISPSFGPLSGGTLVVMDGTGFEDPVNVFFGDRAATGVTANVSGTKLSCRTPTGSTIGQVTVTVKAGAGGEIKREAMFTYLPGPSIPKPTIQSISPNHGPLTGGTKIGILGTNFSGTVSATIGGKPVTDLKVNLAQTLINCVTPVGDSSGGADVTVTVSGVAVTAAGAFTYDPPPLISRVFPADGPISGRSPITISGNNFSGHIKVTFGGEPSELALVNDEHNEIVAAAPARSSAGKVDVVVTSDVGGPGTLENGFTYNPAPGITSVLPPRGLLQGGTEVTVTGSGFLGKTSVKLGNKKIENVSVDTSGNQLSFVTPSGEKPGPVALVITSERTGTVTGTFTYNAPPDVSEITPDNGPLSGGTAIALRGSGFEGTVSLTIGALPASGVVASENGTRLTAVTPAQVAPGSYDLHITSSTNGPATIGRGFTYNGQPPTLETVVPGTGLEAGNTPVVLTGTNFLGDVQVLFGGKPATNLRVTLGGTQITALTPAGTGTVDVEVISSTQGSVTLPVAFSYISDGPPTLTGVLPASGPRGGGAKVTVSGTNFGGIVTITFGGKSATLVSVNNTATKAICLTPIGDAVGPVDVELLSSTNGRVSLGSAYTYNPSPVVNGISPTSGPQAGNALLVLSGSGFSGSVDVTIGGLPCTEVSVNEAKTEVTCRTPQNKVTEPQDIVLTSSATGSITLQDAYTYNPPPALTAVKPSAGPVSGSTTISLIGNGFRGSVGVKVGGQSASDVVVGPDGKEVTAKTPVGSAGEVDVEITCSLTGSATLKKAFTYEPVARITELDPDHGPQGGGTIVAITGTNFGADSRVTFGDTAATVLAVDGSHTKIQVKTRNAPTSGAVDVTVTSDTNGTVTKPAGFTFIPTPVITTLTPTRGPQTGGTTVTFSGSHFPADAVLTIGGVSVTLSGSPTDTQIVGVTGATDLFGPQDVVLSSLLAGTITKSGAFTYDPKPLEITEVKPSTGPQSGDTLVTITGANFNPTISVQFGTSAASDIALDPSATRLTCRTPERNTGGAVAVTVTSTVNGSDTAGGAFTYNDLPDITGITPASGPLTGNTLITLDGTSFLGTVKVTIGGGTAAIVSISPTRVLCRTPRALTSGARDVILTASNAGSVTEPNGFTYNDLPIISSMTPTSGPQGGGTRVTVFGENFFGNVGFTIAGVAATDVHPSQDGRQVDGLTGISLTTGLSDIVVTASLAGTGKRTGIFTYNASPIIQTVVPSSGPLVGLIPIALTGKGFLGNVTLNFGPNNPGSAPSHDPQGTQFSCTLPPGSAGLVDLILHSNETGDLTIPGGFRYNPLPQITSISPTVGPVAGGTEVTFFGSSFFGTFTVTFNGVTAGNPKATPDGTQLTCIAPAGALGTVGVAVTASLSGSASKGSAFTYLPPPTITNFDPADGPTTGGTKVTLTGSGFAGTVKVFFGGKEATGVDVDSDTSLTCFTPFNPQEGPVTVKVDSTATGTANGPFPFTYNPKPTISSISPPSGPLAGHTALTIRGANLFGTLEVTINGITCTNIVGDPINGDLITCDTPPSLTTGAKALIIRSSVNGVVVAPAGFTYNPLPTFTSVTPGDGPLDGGRPVVIKGTGFNRNVTVYFGNNPATGVQILNFGTIINCTIPAGPTNPGKVPIRIESDANGILDVPNAFTYNPRLTFVRITPDNGPLVGTTVSVSGTNFFNVTSVKFGTDPASNIFVDPNGTFITCDTPQKTVPGLYDLSIYSDSHGPLLATGAFRYNPLPVITSVNPPEAPFAGGTPVTINGSGFGGNVSVFFGPNPLVNPQVGGGGTVITGVTPAGTTGGVTITVISSTNGRLDDFGHFQYDPLPTFGGISPPVGPLAGGTPVTISGTNFKGTVTVSIGGKNAPTTNTSPTQIICTTPSATTEGLVDVVINCTFTGSVTATNAFRYTPRPTISNVVPPSGPLVGSTLVSIIGANFNGTTNVSFGNVPATGISVNPFGSAITCFTPAGAAVGPVNVDILSPTNGVTFATGVYTYNPRPTVTAVNPPEGPLAGRTFVTLSGTNFIGTVNVTVGTRPALSVTVQNTTTLVFQTPPGVAIGATPIIVESDSHGQPLVAPTFQYNPAPTAVAASPPDGPQTGGTQVILAGTDFGGAITVVFGTNTATVNSTTSTQIDVTSPPGAAGTVPVTITSSTNGVVGVPGGFTYNPFPTISGISPNNGPIAGGGSAVITGTNFGGSVNVSVGNVLANVTSNSTTSITFDIPAGTGAGGVPVTVVSDRNGAVTLNPGYTYNPLPTFSSLQPNNGPTVGNNKVTINGNNFDGTVSVSFGATGATLLTVANTKLEVIAPPNSTPGLVDVTVNSTRSGVGVNPLSYRYNDLPTLSATPVTPPSGPFAGNTKITITGTGLSGTVNVTIGTRAATGVSTAGAPTSITCFTPPGVTLGPADVIVNSSDTGTVTGTGAFTYNVTPTVNTITPDNGRLAGGTVVTIDGTDFNGPQTGIQVLFGTTPGTFISVNATRTQILVSTPPKLTPATVDVAVTTPDNGTFVKTGGYRYNPAAKIDSVDPIAGPQIGGNPVTIKGQNFGTPLTVTIGGKPATVDVPNSNTNQVVVFAPPNSIVGAKLVRVDSTPNGIADLSGGYSYTPLATTTGLSPPSGPLAGNTFLTINGTNFGPSVSVSVGNALATGVTVNPSRTVVTCLTPPAATPATVDVVVVSGLNGPSTLGNSFTYNPTPTFGPLVLDNGPQVGGNTVVINGNNFGGSLSVTFGTVGATILSSTFTQIQVRVPGSTFTGFVPVTVGSTTHGLTTNANAYRYNDPVSISGIAPTDGPLSGNTSLTISGNNFGNTLSVSVGNALAAITSSNLTQIVCLTPSSSVTGSKPVTVVSTANGTATAAQQFFYNEALGFVSISPTSGPAAGGNIVTVNGSNFNPTFGVTFGTAGATVLMVNGTATQATVRVPAGAVGSVNVTASSTANGFAGLSGQYTYNPPPTLTGVSPTNGPESGGNIVTLTGTNFGDTLSVTFGTLGATILTTNVSRTEITVQVPGQAGPGDQDVTVDSTANGFITRTAFYRYNPKPTITDFNPKNGPASGGQTLTIDGNNFGGTVSVTIGTRAATIVPPTSLTQVKVLTPIGTLNTNVPVILFASNNGGVTASSQYTYNPALTVTGITPNNGPKAGGTTINVTGTNFGGNITVTIGGLTASNVNILSSTQLTAVTPGGTTGLQTVVVNSDLNGQQIIPGGFRYNDLPTLTGLSPNNGPEAGGNTVVLNGTGFGGTLNVTFGTTAATVIGVNGTTSVTVTAPAGTGTVPVILNSSTNGGVTFNSYTYNLPDDIDTVFPASGPFAGGTLITIQGSNFGPTVSVSVGSRAATGVTVNTTRDTITCFTPPGLVLGGNDVTVVSTANGVVVAPGAFTYNVTPTLGLVTPNVGPLLGGTTVTIDGTDLGPTVSVTLGTRAATGVTVNPSETQITFVTPPGVSAGTVDIIVSSTKNGTNTKTAGFTYLSPPTWSSVFPTNGPQQGGTVITIDGTNFGPTLSVSVGIALATDVQSVSSTRITAVTPPSTTTGVGVAITVVSTANGSVTQNNAYTYNKTPTISGLNPTSGPIAGNSQVAINGTDFGPTLGVTFGNAPATIIQVNGTNQIVVLTPPGPAVGMVDVLVASTQNGTVSTTSGNGFTYNATPTITAVNPNAGPLSGGTTVNVTGTGFVLPLTVSVGGAFSSTVTVNSSVSLTFSTPSSLTAGTRDVVINSTLSGIATAPGAFTYNASFNRNDFSTGANPRGVAVGDFNKDGKVDVAVANQIAGTVSVLLNQTSPGSTGSGFGGHVDFTSGSLPLAVGVGDIDLDGKPDIVSANTGDAGIRVLANVTSPGSSSPTFTTSINFSTDTNPTAVAVADMNGDGKPDLATANDGPGTVTVMMNTTTPGGSPNFGTATDFNSGTGPTAIAIADINLDGKPDLIVANRDDNRVAVLLNQTSAGSSSPSFGGAQTFATDTSPTSVAVYDLNGDGFPDIVTANAVANTTSTLFNTTSRGSSTVSMSTAVNVSMASAANAVALGDLDRDGRADVATANNASNNVSIRLNQTASGASTVSWGGRTETTVGSSPQSIAMADFNNDGSVDIVVSNRASSTMSILLNTTQLGTIPATTLAKQNVTVQNAPTSVVLADFNSDGKLDIAVSNASSDRISTLYNTTTLGSSTVSFSTGSLNTGNTPAQLATGDLNGDGLADLVVANQGSHTLTVYVNSSGSPGTINSVATLNVSTNGVPLGVAIADLNRDGLPDIVAVNSATNDISAFVNTTTTLGGNPTFTLAQSFAASVTPHGIAAGDLNGDGVADLAITNNAVGTITVLLNAALQPPTSNVSFATPSTLGTDLLPEGIVMGDFNGDGINDLAVANVGSGNISLLRNTTSPGATSVSFATNPSITTGTGPISIQAADVNGDGILDLVTSNNGASTISILLNRTAPGSGSFTFATKVDPTTSNVGGGIGLGDLNGDGIPDFVNADFGSNTLSILLNTTVR